MVSYKIYTQFQVFPSNTNNLYTIVWFQLNISIYNHLFIKLYGDMHSYTIQIIFNQIYFAPR